MYGLVYSKNRLVQQKQARTKQNPKQKIYEAVSISHALTERTEQNPGVLEVLKRVLMQMLSGPTP